MEITDKQINDILNGSRNNLKHLAPLSQGEEVALKPVDDSLLMLVRAIANYAKLTGNLTGPMHKFANDDNIQQMLEKITEAD